MAIKTLEIPFVAYPAKTGEPNKSFDAHYANMLATQEAQLKQLDELLNAGYVPVGQPATYEIQRMLWQHWTLHKADETARYEYDAVIYNEPIPVSDSYLSDDWELLNVKETHNKATYIFRREKR
jgi:hypothetical protein